MRRTKGILIGLVVLLVVALGAYVLVNRWVRQRFDQELASMQNRMEVHYGSLRFEPWSGKIRAGQVSATMADGQLKLLAESLWIRDWKRDAATGLVERMGITGKGVRIHGRGKNGGWIPRLSGYGYEDPKLGLELDYEYASQTRTLEVERLKLGGRDMGALSLQGKFADAGAVDWGRLGEGTTMQRMAALGSVKVAALQLEYHDFGLLTKVFEHHAAARGKAAGDIANEVYAAVEGQKSLRLTPAMLESVQKFLTNPDRIELVLQPAKPVGTMEWVTALLFRGDLIKLLGVDIRT